MKTLYEMRNYVFNQIEDDSDPALIDSWINRAIEGITAEYEFAGYRRTSTITPDASGKFFVPPAFQAAILLYPEDTSATTDDFGKFVYHTITSRRGNRIARAYYMDDGYNETLGVVENITMTNGSTTVTTVGSAFLATDVGDAIRFGYIDGTSPDTAVTNDSFEYTVDSFTDVDNLEITPAWGGVTGTYMMILRPVGVKRFIVYDSEDTAYTNNVILKYKVNPQPLYNDYDGLFSDIGEAVEYRALIEAYRNQKYDVDAERLMSDTERAIARALASETRGPRENIPEGLFGGMPAFSIHTKRRVAVQR